MNSTFTRVDAKIEFRELSSVMEIFFKNPGVIMRVQEVV